MFNAISLVEDPSVAEAIEQLALETRQVAILRSSSRVPGQYELIRLLNTFQPDLVFLEIDNDGETIALAEAIAEHDSSIVIIGLGGAWMRRLGPHLSDSGFAAIMPLPLTRDGFQEAVQQAVHRVHSWQMDNLICFLPAKAGCGASTAALNVAGAVAATGTHSVLLVEADLHSGPVGDMVKAKPRLSTREVLSNTDHLDLNYWRNAIVRFGGADLLLTDRAKKQPIPTWIDYFHLLQFLRNHYHLIIFDLPEVVNDATAEVVRRSRRVHVVTTPETSPVSLARQRIAELESRGTPASRMHVVINRWHKSDPSPAEIEHELNLPVAAVLRNDYPSVRRASVNGAYISSTTALGQAYGAFANSLVGIQETRKSGGLLQLLTGRL